MQSLPWGWANLRLAFGLFLVGLVSAGCSSSLPPTADKDMALSALRAALDVWQKGEKPESLKQRSQPIQMIDSDWSQGVRLSRFEFDETQMQPSGFDQGVAVKLWLEDGKKNPRTVKYTIATTPALVITRNFAD